MRVLSIVGNPKPEEEAASKQLLSAFKKGLKESGGDSALVEVDLYESPPPYYTYKTYRYFWYPVFVQGYQPSEEEKKDVEYSLEQCKLFKEAEAIVITCPMWNFSLPAIVKAWIDQVLMPKEIFDISKEGVKPLHRVKKVILLTSSGGVYPEDDPKDNFKRLVKAAFGFIQIEKIRIVWADGQNIFFFEDHKDRKDKAIKEAHELGLKIGRM